MVTAIKIKKNFKDDLEAAYKFYRILSVLNDFKLTPLEIKIIAYTVVRGNLSSGTSKDKFVKIYNSTKSSIIKTIPKLIKEKYLVREHRKIFVNPSLFFNLKERIILQLNIGCE